jgi:hypothetical protein
MRKRGKKEKSQSRAHHCTSSTALGIVVLLFCLLSTWIERVSEVNVYCCYQMKNLKGEKGKKV